MRKKTWLWLGVLTALLLGLALLLALVFPLGAKKTPLTQETFLASPPDYAREPGCVVNGDRPFFTAEELREARGLRFSEQDALGRSGPALALLGPETLATEKRSPIGDLRPSGWHTVRYDDRIEDRYLYNRCHLVAYQLCGENADPRNLITGTRYMNIEGMLPLEIQVGDYIEASGRHVLYRVTPVFLGRELLARGVLLEARSLEDGGRSLQLCRYVFNVQPGVLIDYADGESRADPSWTAPSTERPAPPADADPDSELQSCPAPTDAVQEELYVLNTRTLRFHRPGCPSAEEISEGNRVEFRGSREELLEQGYSPCGRCGP
ncbi:MAG: DNA/RNA non-specific endonuclease [Oscillospiraceae bacterium]|nr:DNA/RNA non-specific endonuclease [Oscillospiraceae bacterium]MBR3474942.1 DNA/RNA non-specific endonuclease [Oscillospiraceae bacterium]